MIECSNCHYFRHSKCNDYGYCDLRNMSLYESEPCKCYVNLEALTNRTILFSNAKTFIGRYMDYMMELIREVQLNPGIDPVIAKALGRCWVELINIGMIWTDREAE